jgi:hypothetical protein
LSTGATFSEVGTYFLKLTVSDGRLSSIDTLRIIVTEEELPDEPDPVEGSPEPEEEFGSDSLYPVASDGTPYSPEAVPSGNVRFVAELPGVTREHELSWLVTDPGDSSFEQLPSNEALSSRIRSACPPNVSDTCSLGFFRFESHGKRVVTLTVTAPDGSVRTLTSNIIVVTPLRVEVYGPKSVLVEENVSFIGRIIGGIEEPVFTWNINHEDAIATVSGLGPCISDPDVGLDDFVVEDGVPCQQVEVNYVFDEPASRFIQLEVVSAAEDEEKFLHFTIDPFWGVIEIDVTRFITAMCGARPETKLVPKSHFSLFREGRMEDIAGLLEATVARYAPSEWGGVCFDRGMTVGSTGSYVLENVSPEVAKEWITEFRETTRLEEIGDYGGNGWWVVRHRDDGELTEFPTAEICWDSLITCGL